MENKDMLVEMAKLRNEYADGKNLIIAKEYAKIEGADYMLSKFEQLIKNSNDELKSKESIKAEMIEMAIKELNEVSFTHVFKDGILTSEPWKVIKVDHAIKIFRKILGE